MMVVVYHLYPRLLPGGYVGVDVFFVISGFLITGHLANVQHRERRVRLVDFYGRRARRLMPAAALVLAVTWLTARVVLPVTQLPDTATQVRASALYFQNWELARNAVDYLTSSNAPTPVQHFWSLSVEEQFYLVWPALFLVSGLVARLGASGRDQRYASRARVTMAALATAVIGASFWYSVHETRVDAAAAYFVTPTRIWELACGGLLALLSGRVSSLLTRLGPLSWLGLALIVWSAFFLNDSSAFPGHLALLPVAGSTLVLACGSARARLGTAKAASVRPAVFLGDISYSLYLWHWPLIVFWKTYSGASIGALDGPAIFAASVVLAWLTKVFVEDRVRLSSFIAGRPWRSLATVTAAIVPVALASLWIADRPAPYTAVSDSQHPGAGALTTSAGAVAPRSASPPAHASLAPPIAAAATDYEVASNDRCQAKYNAVTMKTCVFGDTTAPVQTVALVGDSVAGEWSSPLADIAKRKHWKLVVVTHSSCPWTSTMVTQTGHTKPYTVCADWGRRVLDYLTKTLKPDVVIATDRPANGIPSHPKNSAQTRSAIGAGMADYWNRLTKAGIRVVGIRETPEMHKDIPTCLAKHGNTVASCSVPAAEAIYPNTAIQKAVQQTPGASIIDMNTLICSAATCSAVVGNIIVYRDTHHLTDTYSRSLEPYLQQKLLATGKFTAS